MNTEHTEVILGPPGTGKTTTILKMVEDEMRRGISSDRIGFVSFTKRAIDEGVQRACKMFNLRQTDLPHFRTLHSAAFRQLGMSRNMVINRKHLGELADLLGLELTGRSASDDDFLGMSPDDRMLFMENLSRSTMRPLRETWERSNDDEVDWWALERFSKSLAQFKKTRGLVDFTDMINDYVADGRAPELESLFVDEAQDLSRSQWAMVDLMSSRAKRVVVAGDDDQALYQWAGADVQGLVGLKGRETVLHESHRVPRKAHEVAEQVLKKITVRRQKPWRARDYDGVVRWATEIAECDMSTGTWLILVRNNYMIPPIEAELMRQGLNFKSTNKSPTDTAEFAAMRCWEALRRGSDVDSDDALDMVKHSKQRGLDLKKLKEHRGAVSAAELKNLGLQNLEKPWHEALNIPSELQTYFLSARRRGEKLLAEPRIRVSTIHSAKGAEADHVVVHTDMSARCVDSMDRDADAEHRVFYVAVTRCRESLTMITPSTVNSYVV